MLNHCPVTLDQCDVAKPSLSRWDKLKHTRKKKPGKAGLILEALFRHAQ